MTHIGVFQAKKKPKTKLLKGAVENNFIWQHMDPPLGYTVCTVWYNLHRIADQANCFTLISMHAGLNIINDLLTNGVDRKLFFYVKCAYFIA